MSFPIPHLRRRSLIVSPKGGHPPLAAKCNDGGEIPPSLLTLCNIPGFAYHGG
jgi:hypothetical protein